MLVLRGLCFLLIFLVAIGLAVGGTIWMMMLVTAGPIGLAVAFTLFPVLYSLCRELSSGVLFLLCRLPMLFTLVLIILVLSCWARKGW